MSLIFSVCSFIATKYWVQDDKFTKYLKSTGGMNVTDIMRLGPEQEI